MANGTFGGGNGNPENPFLVEDAADLDAVRNQLSKAYKQVANVDLSSYANWVPIGGPSGKFLGVYDGGNFNVSNLNINTTNTYTGLFGSVDGNIVGVNVTSGSIVSTALYIGAVAGAVTRPVKFCSNQGCSITKTGGTATSTNYVGGVVGSGLAEDSFNTATVSSTGRGNGGVVGGASSGAMATRCHNTGALSSSGNGMAGIIGVGVAFNCYNTGSVAAVAASGLAAGIATSGDATDCYNAGVLTATTQYGISVGKATRCYNTANLSSQQQVYGICSANATDCFNTGTLNSNSGTVYGICGGVALRCINSGNIRGFTGGYGITINDAKNCYALFSTMTRAATSSETVNFAQITTYSGLTTDFNYALDTMIMVFE